MWLCERGLLLVLLAFVVSAASASSPTEFAGYTLFNSPLNSTVNVTWPLLITGNVTLQEPLVFLAPVLVAEGAMFAADFDFACPELTILGEASFVGSLTVGGATNLVAGSTTTLGGALSVGGTLHIGGVLVLAGSGPAMAANLTTSASGAYVLVLVGGVPASSLAVGDHAQLNIAAAAMLAPGESLANGAVFTALSFARSTGSIGYARLVASSRVRFDPAHADSLVVECAATSCSFRGARYVGAIAEKDTTNPERNLLVGLVTGIVLSVIVMGGVACWAVGYARELHPLTADIRQLEKAAKARSTLRAGVARRYRKDPLDENA